MYNKHFNKGFPDFSTSLPILIGSYIVLFYKTYLLTYTSSL